MYLNALFPPEFYLLNHPPGSFQWAEWTLSSCKTSLPTLTYSALPQAQGGENEKISSTPEGCKHFWTSQRSLPQQKACIWSEHSSSNVSSLYTEILEDSLDSLLSKVNDSYHHWLSLKKTLHKWNYTAHTFLWLASFVQPYVASICMLDVAVVYSIAVYYFCYEYMTLYPFYFSWLFILFPAFSYYNFGALNISVQVLWYKYISISVKFIHKDIITMLSPNSCNSLICNTALLF